MMSSQYKKNPEVCLDFGYEPVCIELGKANQKLNLQDHYASYKNRKCGVLSKACLEPHESCFIWCNLCLHDTAVVNGYNTTNGKVDYLCECEDGLYWNFSTQYNAESGSVSPARYTLDVTGDDGKGCYADTIIIWNHDLCNDYKNIVELYVDNIKIDDAIVDPECKHCCTNNGECSPIYFYLDKGIIGTNWELRFTTKVGYQHCIGNIIIGSSFPIDLEVGYENIFAASRYRRKNNNNPCGWMPSVLEEKTYDTDITLTDIEESWIIDYWQDFIWYADRYPFYFAFSKNNCPTFISRVRLSAEGVDPPTYSDEICQTLTIPLEMRRHPEKKKRAFSCRLENGEPPIYQVPASTIRAISFTELTGIDNDGSCFISDNPAPRMINDDDAPNNLIEIVGNGLTIRTNRLENGVKMPFEYTITCGGSSYKCNACIQSLGSPFAQ